jgi:putative intracellular protease/amidase
MECHLQQIIPIGNLPSNLVIRRIVHPALRDGVYDPAGEASRHASPPAGGAPGRQPLHHVHDIFEMKASVEQLQGLRLRCGSASSSTDDVDRSDIGATFGVLSKARRIEPALEMFLVAARAGSVRLTGGLEMIAHHGFADCPAADAFIVTGGSGWKREAANPAMLDFLRGLPRTTGIVASVCTGAMILAAAGLLDGHHATTKREVSGAEIAPIAILRDQYPAVRVVTAPVVDEGAVVTGGGVCLAIDLTLHLLERLGGPTLAAETARIIEYTTARRANLTVFQAAARD